MERLNTGHRHGCRIPHCPLLYGGKDSQGKAYDYGEDYCGECQLQGVGQRLHDHIFNWPSEVDRVAEVPLGQVLEEKSVLMESGLVQSVDFPYALNLLFTGFEGSKERYRVTTETSQVEDDRRQDQKGY